MGRDSKRATQGAPLTVGDKEETVCHSPPSTDLEVGLTHDQACSFSLYKAPRASDLDGPSTLPRATTTALHVAWVCFIVGLGDNPHLLSSRLPTLAELYTGTSRMGLWGKHWLCWWSTQVKWPEPGREGGYTTAGLSPKQKATILLWPGGPTLWRTADQGTHENGVGC